MTGKAARKTTRTPLLEWVTAAVGTVCVLGALGVIAASAMRPSTPPSLDVALVVVVKTPRGYTAEVEVTNSGSAPAADVEVSARLADETATVTLDYVSGGGRETASLAFSSDPRQGDLQLAARAWTEP